MFNDLKDFHSDILPKSIEEIEFYSQCAYKLIGSRWMSYILSNLSQNQVMRFGELRKNLPAEVTHKMLTQQLKALEDKGLVQRIDYHYKAPKVEYSLTEKGMAIRPIISEITKYYDGEKEQCRSLLSKDCPLENALNVISGKWKTSILMFLWLNNASRYTQIKSVLPSITNTYLSAQLKALKSDGLVLRTEYLEIPPRVEYSLTEKGLEIISLINLIITTTKEVLYSNSNPLSLIN